ncbi:MFS transporter [Amycolatopsis sp. NPDC058986]|uniref:MFS transporter n=1 Tax=unclassified Amycolatopsis TaxID=2618356 RepID=UPI00367095D6
MVEWTGTGLFLAVSTIYFVKVVGLGTASVGAGMSVAGGLAMLAAVPIARLSERFGPRPLLVALNLVRAVATIAYLRVDGWGGFLVIATVVAVTEQSLPPLVQAYIGSRARQDLRGRVMALQRTVVNVGISFGGLIAGVVLGADSRSAFHWLLVGGAVAYLAVALLLLGMRDEGGKAGARPDFRALLTDRRLLSLTAYHAVLSLWTPILNVAFPLWLVTRTDVSDRFVGFLYAVNTVGCIALQYPLNGLYGTVRRSWLACGIAGGLLAVSCAGFAVAPGFPAAGAIAIFAGTIVVLTFAEVLQVGASWTLSYEFAPDNARSAYLVLFNLGRTTANRVAGPLLMTGVVIALGTTGWIALGVVFVLTALVPVLVLRTHRTGKRSVARASG